MNWASEVVQAAVIAGVVTLLVALGRGVQYTVSLLLDAYRQQADKTVAAKDADLAAKTREIKLLGDTVLVEVRALRRDLSDLRHDMWTIRQGDKP